jgi:oligoribonuclease NrnB/cAMP/cGMP phosphodiesterase (DHH superfamily)
MIALPRPEVILTHESDLDGLVAGVLLQRLAKVVHDVEVPLEAWNYNGWKQRPLNERSAWVTDLSFEPRLDRPGWVIVDHHATTIHPRHATLIHDLEKSASLLCYELCREAGLGSPELDRLVRLANVGDLFLEDDPEFVIANDYANLVKTYQFWNLHRLLDGEIERLLDHPFLEVMEVKRRIEDPIGLDWSRANVEPITGEVALVHTTVGNVNLIVHQLLEQKLTPFAVLVTIFKKSNGAMIVSLRSKNGQALETAQKLQGGGHANAAGATLPRSVRSHADAADYLRQALNPTGSTPQLNSLEELFAAVGVAKG